MEELARRRDPRVQREVERLAVEVQEQVEGRNEERRKAEDDAAELFGDFEEEDRQEDPRDDEGDNMVVDAIRKPKGRGGKKWDDHARWVMSQTEASVAHIGVINVVSGTTPKEMTFYDDVTGARLDTDMVITARAEEMSEFRKHGVYIKVPVEQCRAATGKMPIGVRWVDINKGDEVNPD